MELFYHVSRDIELPRTGRRLTVPAGPRACEACGAQLAGGEPSEGGTFGLAFCAACRDRLDRSAIQIHFCDGCEVSVPLYAVEEGTALVGDGRILCLRCRSPAARSRLPLLLGLAIAVGLLVGAACALYL